MTKNKRTDYEQNINSLRFWKNVTFTKTCWIYKPTFTGGYGRFTVGGKLLRAHRWIYEQLIGPIPKDRQCDHLCRNRACVNPAHIELVTPKENNARGNSPSALNSRKTLCKRGHPLTGENLTFWSGGRQCRACAKIRADKRRKNTPASLRLIKYWESVAADDRKKRLSNAWKACAEKRK